jgi:hypothetical protein
VEEKVKIERGGKRRWVRRNVTYKRERQSEKERDNDTQSLCMVREKNRVREKGMRVGLKRRRYLK